jgi:hypothetical protein
MPDVEFVARGAVAQLYKIRRWPRGIHQVLLVGPAGTGKTRGLLEFVDWLCSQYPGIRVLFLRRTKESLAESVLDTWENHVLAAYDHEWRIGGGQRNMRQSYTNKNGSHIVLGGLKDKTQVTRTLSTQYDVVICFEAREIDDPKAWQMLARANRNWKMPFQLRIADTNPGNAYHWLNTTFPTAEDGGAFHYIPDKYRDRGPYTIRCEDRHVNVVPCPETIEVDDDGHAKTECPDCGKRATGSVMFRLLSQFRDNPTLWDSQKKAWTEGGFAYVEQNLALLTGSPRANLYEGRWAAEEGVIYEGWDPEVHIVDPEDAPRDYKWFCGALDPGFRHPTSFQVWGVIGDSVWLVFEEYRTEENSDWWAEKILELNRRYPMEALVVDPSEPDYIERLNDRFGEMRGRDGERIARRGNNSILTGIDMVRWALSERDGGPRLHVVRGYLESRDRKRTDALKPACFTEEIVAWTWRKTEEGQPYREVPDPLAADHSMDNARMMAMFIWGADLSPLVKSRDYPDWSFGAELGHGEVEMAP